jgi:hypothetical protein
MREGNGSGKNGKGNAIKSSLLSAAPRSVGLASEGVHTGTQFAKLMSALMSDIIEEKVTPAVANAACNAGGKLLKVVEMQLKYGTKTKGKRQTLQLA